MAGMGAAAAQLAAFGLADVPELLGGLLVLLLLVALYFLPALIAYARGHDQVLMILVIDFLFAWTVLGWGIALLWSITRIAPGEATVPFWRRKPPA
jgi:Superinfection immunity protein